MTTGETSVSIVFKNTVLMEVFSMTENTGDTGGEFKLSYGLTYKIFCKKDAKDTHGRNKAGQKV